MWILTYSTNVGMVMVNGTSFSTDVSFEGITAIHLPLVELHLDELQLERACRGDSATNIFSPACGHQLQPGVLPPSPTDVVGISELNAPSSI